MWSTLPVWSRLSWPQPGGLMASTSLNKVGQIWSYWCPVWCAHLWITNWCICRMAVNNRASQSHKLLSKVVFIFSVWVWICDAFSCNILCFYIVALRTWEAWPYQSLPNSEQLQTSGKVGRDVQHVHIFIFLYYFLFYVFIPFLYSTPLWIRCMSFLHWLENQDSIKMRTADVPNICCSFPVNMQLVCQLAV